MYLMNISNFTGDMNKFNGSWNQVEQFLDKHQLDGIELIRYQDDYLDKMPNHILKGFHLKYYPTWLEFYQGNWGKACQQCGGEEAALQYFGGSNPQVLVDAFKVEYEKAKELKAEYMVYHVAHVTTEHSFTRQFDYTDDDVLDATVDLVNKSFDTNSDTSLLFENLWWPGLTLLDKDKTEHFLDRIHYKKKGIMLDLGHMMITNPSLKTPAEATDYILSCVDKLGSLKQHIKGIHVNMSLPGDYLKQDHVKDYEEILNTDDSVERYIKTIKHIKKIDCHQPYDDPTVKSIIESIKPDYVVFEVVSKDYNQLDQFMSIQNKAMGRLS
jgi:sugar phosphate isomerase/epimerase